MLQKLWGLEKLIYSR